MDSRGQRWQAGPGRFPRYLSKDGLGTSRYHGCVGRITEHIAYTLRIWAVPCWELSRGWMTALLWIQQPTPMEDARVLPPLVDALKNKSFVLGRAQIAAMSECSPNNFLPRRLWQWQFAIKFPDQENLGWFPSCQRKRKLHCFWLQPSSPPSSRALLSSGLQAPVGM